MSSSTRQLTKTTQRIFSYADKYDWCLNALALVASIGKILAFCYIHTTNLSGNSSRCYSASDDPDLWTICGKVQFISERPGQPRRLSE